MRILIILFILLPLAAFSQSPLNQTDASGLRQGMWQKKYPNGRLMYEGRFADNRPVGEWKRYHDNGALRAVLEHRAGNDTVDARLFDTNGKLMAEGQYVNEKKTGTWTHYSGERKISEETYVNDLRHGKSRIFYPGGELLEETTYADNQKTGPYKAYFITGKPFLECTYAYDLRQGFCVTYYPSGAMEVDARYQDGLPDGDWKYFTETGELRYTLKYREGELLNPEVLLQVETQILENLESQGKILLDPEKYMDDPTEYLLQNQKQP
jgi:antitoxin component YwqK of YwqJK toxin-antitoxin module